MITKKLFCMVAGAMLAGLVSSRVVAEQPSLFSLSLEDLANIQLDLATGTPKTLQAAPSVASVITAADIAMLGARTLDEVLETVPGLHVSLSSLNRLDAVYSLRGIHTGFNPHVQLLLDGNPVKWSAQGGRPYQLRLPTSAIAKIEVIRGPGSALYGSDAFSGVINVITKAGESAVGFEAGMRTGSFGSRDFWVTGTKVLSAWQLSANLNYMESDGDTSRVVDSDLQTTLDDIFATSASLAPAALASDYRVFDIHLGARNDNWNFNLWHWRSDDTGNGVGGAQALDPSSKEQFKISSLGVSYDLPVVLGWSQQLKFNYFYNDVESNLTLLPAGSRVPIGSDGNIDFINPTATPVFTDGVIGKPGGLSRDQAIEWQAQFDQLKDHSIRIAVGYKKQRFSSTELKNFGPGILDGSEDTVSGTLTDISDTEFVFLADSERDIHHVMLQDEWSLAAKIMVTAGVRLDNYSDFGSTLNPRLALVWNTTDRLTSKVMYGSAFRAPSFGELSFINNPAAIGNSELQPETIDTSELLFDYRPLDNVKTRLNLYYYKAQNLIEFVPGAGGAVAENARDQQGHGLEWELIWQPHKTFNLAVNAAWQKSKDTETREAISDAPGKQLTLIANWRFRSEWSLNAHLNKIMDRERAVTDTRSAISDYSRLDFNLSKKNLLPGLGVSIKVKNSFDRDAREPSTDSIIQDYPLEGRSVWLELNYATF